MIGAPLSPGVFCVAGGYPEVAFLPRKCCGPVVRRGSAQERDTAESLLAKHEQEVRALTKAKPKPRK
jgi:hypothetical protein